MVTETQINYANLRVEMANNEHLLMLKRGVREWNAWRAGCEDTPFLQGANLANLDLKGINFQNADLRDVRFDHSNLGSADFSGAKLVGANFLSAFLIGAKFNTNDRSVPAALCDYANFTCAHLSQANMSGAHFVSADFQEADLINAKLVKSELTRANLRNVKAAPLIDKERVLATVRSYFGATMPDLSDDELQELRRLCEVFLQPSSDAGQMENERKAALVQAKIAY